MRPAWTEAIDHAEQSMNACERRMSEIVRAANVGDRVRRVGAVRAHHRIERAADWLLVAHAFLSEAIEDLNLALILIEMAPDDAAGAAEALFATTRRITEVGVRLALVSEQLQAASEAIVEEAKNGVGPEPKVEPRFFLGDEPNVAALIEALFRRRQRSKAAAPGEIHRRISRGRAPPLL